MASIPPHITEIGEYAFSGCRSLIKIVLPPGLKFVGRNAFDGAALPDVINAGFVFPNSVEGFVSYLDAIGEDGKPFDADGNLLAYAAGYMLPLDQLPLRVDAGRPFVFKVPPTGALKALDQIHFGKFGEGKHWVLDVEALQGEGPGETPTVEPAHGHL
jgi:hypothetical protein